MLPPRYKFNKHGFPFNINFKKLVIPALSFFGVYSGGLTPTEVTFNTSTYSCVVYDKRLSISISARI